MPESATSVLDSPQLALRLALQDDATLDNFLPRAALETLLDSLKSIPAEPLQYLHGAAASGKTHLLQAICHRHEGAVYLPLSLLQDSPPAALLDGLEQSPLLALDDLQAIAGRGDWEEALFHLINRARAAACPLWIAASRPPAGLPIQLPDLVSRLAGGITWALPPCSEAEKGAILRFRAQQRGLQLSTPVVNYICARGSRALDEQIALLERLDRASLQLQRPLTVPLVREVMGWGSRAE